MEFLDANTLFRKVQPSDLSAEEQAMVNFYQTSLAFSRAMVNYRLENDINQSQLADILNTTQSNISRYESGEHNYTIKKLYELAAQMSIRVDICVDLISRKENCDRSISTEKELNQNIDFFAEDMIPAA